MNDHLTPSEQNFFDPIRNLAWPGRDLACPVLSVICPVLALAGVVRAETAPSAASR